MPGAKFSRTNIFLLDLLRACVPTCERESSPFVTHAVPSQEESSSQGIFAAAFSSSDRQAGGLWDIAVVLGGGFQVSCRMVAAVLGHFPLSQLCRVAEGCDSFCKCGAKSSPLKCPGEGGAGSWPGDVLNASCPSCELAGFKDLIKARFYSKPGFAEPPAFAPSGGDDAEECPELVKGGF